MSATVQINDKTAFVLDDGRLVAVEEAREIELNREDGKRDLSEGEAWKLVPDFIREEDRILFDTVVNWTLEKIDTWAEIKSEKEVNWDRQQVYKYLSSSLKKSALFERLLSGKDPLSFPPPKSYGYPWYDLVDAGEDICLDVFFSHRDYLNKKDFHDKARIDGEDWYILDEVEKDQSYIAHWDKDEDTLYLLSRLTEEDKARYLHPRLSRLSNSKDKYSWKLQRMEQIEDGG